MIKFYRRHLVILSMILSVSGLLSFSALQGAEVGVAWIGTASMPERISRGVEERLQEIAPEFRLEYQPALKDEAALTATIKQFETVKDALIILRSNGAKYLAQHKTSLPTFIGGTNDPYLLGTVNNLDAPEGNITGVTYALPIGSHFVTFKVLLPDMKKIVLLVEKGHPSGVIEQEETRKAALQFDLDLLVFEISSTKELISQVKAHAETADAFIAGTQAQVIDHIGTILEHADMTPLLSFSSKPVKDGALGGFVADDHKLGRMLADSLVDVVKNGKAIRDVPIKRDPKPIFYVNTTTAKRLGIEIPFHVLALSKTVE